MQTNGIGPILSRLFDIKEETEDVKAKVITKRDKVIRVMLRRAGIAKLPKLSAIMQGKCGSRVKIKDVGLFIGTPTEEVLAELAAVCLVKNRVNLSAEVTLKQVIEVGAEILRSGRMYQPIQVARIAADGAMECTSGRHRLAFLALVYGAEVDIPLYIEDMTINEARDAVVVANQARSTKALERAEHAALQAVGGNVDASQDELYTKTVTSKSKARRYCVYSVISRGYPAKLAFPVSQTASRRDGGLTTITNIENFWALALDWQEGTTRKEYDEALNKSVKFLNEFTASLQRVKGFDAAQHLSSMALSAVGKYFRTRMEVTGNDWEADDIASLAVAIVEMGEIGRIKSEKTYATLAKTMRGE